MVRQLVLSFVRFFNIHESGHNAGILVCSRYGHHVHLPLDLIKWYI